MYEEAKIALRYGLVLKDILNARGHSVFMTRIDNEDYAPYWERAENAKNAGCDIFVSLHLNDFEDDQANGLEVLYRDSDDKKLSQALQEALIQVTSIRDRGIKKRDDLAVLKFNGPAALIELGFIANDKDREVLVNPYKREKICIEIVNVLEEYNI